MWETDLNNWRGEHFILSLGRAKFGLIECRMWRTRGMVSQSRKHYRYGDEKMEYSKGLLVHVCERFA